MRVGFSCLVPLCIFIPSSSQAANLVVTTPQDAGPGSLSAALVESNRNGTPDLVLFDPSLTGSTLRPRTPLPALTEGHLTIDGDIDGDALPDIMLHGGAAGGAGLMIRSAANTVRGLALKSWDRAIA